MVKSYLRYEALGAFGLVVGHEASPAVLFDASGKLALAAACENVIVWDVRRGAARSTWRGDKSAVTCLARGRGGSADLVAVGYADGSIKLWSLTTNSHTVVFTGHRGAVTSLIFDADGARLASGSADTCVILWDIVAEQGLFRLRGHRDMVTSLLFINEGRHLASSSKDNLVKVWDLSAQHCVETLVGLRSEVWSLAMTPDGRTLLAGCTEGAVHVWHLDAARLDDALRIDPNAAAAAPSTSTDVTEDAPPRAFTSFGVLTRTSSTERVVGLQVDPTGTFVACQGADRTVEIFRILDEAATKKKKLRKRRRRREKEAARAAEAGEEAPAAAAADEEDIQLTAPDVIVSLGSLRASAKIRSFDATWSGSKAQLLLALHDNSIALFSATMDDKSMEAELAAAVELPGHRSDVRALAISSDDQMLASASSDTLKIWNIKTRVCIRTMSCGYALSCLFVPGNRHVLIGTKEGRLELYDIASSTCVHVEEDAHAGAVWSLSLFPDGKQFVSGSADKTVKFWDFELLERTLADSGAVTRTLGIVHTRTLTMTDDVLAVRVSPDGRLLALSLLDSTIKVFFADTLKFFLSLYGHKLPALALDISFDSALLVSASADKTVKIWGLDFGDCHRSLHAHGDSIMQVKFVPGTHYFWSVGKDRLVKEWDGDKFENIMSLEGHFGEVWALAVSSRGDFVVTASHDRSIRLWERTDEQLFLDEERERQLEEMFEAPVADDAAAGLDGAAGKGEGDSAEAAGRTTLETVRAGERLIEALELAAEETYKMKEWEASVRAAEASGSAPPAQPPLHPLFSAARVSSPSAYVLSELASIRSSDLDQALLVLSFAHLHSLIGHLRVWLDNGWRLELSARVLIFLLNVHHPQIVANRAFRPALAAVGAQARRLLGQYKDAIGFNLAALGFLQRESEAAGSRFFEDVMAGGAAAKAAEEKRKKRIKSVKKQRVK